MPDIVTVQSQYTGKKYEIELAGPYTPADDEMIDAEIRKLESPGMGQANIKDTGRYEPSARMIAQAAKSAGFTGRALREAIAIALAESGGNPRAANRTAPDDSHGLWQVNYFEKLRGERTKKFGPPEAQYDPNINARAAYQISGGGKNFKPWTTYVAGKHKQYLSVAEKAAAEVEGGYQLGGPTLVQPQIGAGAGAAIGAKPKIGKQPILTQREFIEQQRSKGMIADVLQGVLGAAQATGDSDILEAAGLLPFANKELTDTSISPARRTEAIEGARAGAGIRKSKVSELPINSNTITSTLGAAIQAGVGPLGPIEVAKEFAARGGEAVAGMRTGTLNPSMSAVPSSGGLAAGMITQPLHAGEEIGKLLDPEVSLEDKLGAGANLLLNFVGPAEIMAGGAIIFKPLGKAGSKVLGMIRQAAVNKDLKGLTAALRESEKLGIPVDDVVRGFGIDTTQVKAKAAEMAPNPLRPIKRPSNKPQVQKAPETAPAAKAGQTASEKPVVPGAQDTTKVTKPGAPNPAHTKGVGGTFVDRTGKTHQIDVSGKLDDEGYGLIEASPVGMAGDPPPKVRLKGRGGDAYIESAQLPEDARGAGLGTELYRSAIEEAFRSGVKVVRSSHNISDAAARVYRSLSKYFDVIETAPAKRGVDDLFNSRFEVRPKPAPTKGVAPKQGRVSKKSGAARFGTKAGLRKSAESAVRVLQKAAVKASEVGRISKKNLQDATLEVAGNTFHKLNRYGDAGKAISSGLSGVLRDSAYGLSNGMVNIKRGIHLAETLAKRSGSRLTKAQLDEIPFKVERGETLTAPERVVWRAWTAEEDKLTKSGVPVSRTANEAFEGLKGEWAEVMIEDRKYVRGKIIEVVPSKGGDDFFEPDGVPTPGKVVIQVPPKTKGAKAQIVTVTGDNPFYTRQMVERGKYWRKQLTEEKYDRLRDRSSKEYAEALKHIIETNQAKDIGTAAKLLEDELGYGDAITEGGKIRLQRARTGVKLPDSWYERGFIESAERHLSESYKKIAFQKHFGRQGETLAQILKAAQETREVGQPALMGENDAKWAIRELNEVLDMHPKSAFEIGATKALGLVSDFDALRLLTSPTTAAIQLTQEASGRAILGGATVTNSDLKLFNPKNGFKYLKDFADEVRRSGVIEQDVRDMFSLDSSSRITKKALTGGLFFMKLADRALRFRMAHAGVVKVQNLIKNVAKDNEAYKFLTEYAHFTDEDIAQMYATKTMTPEQRRIAMEAGVKTQVQTRTADLPKMSRYAVGRQLMRLKTYAIGQSYNVGHVAKAAARGNWGPAVQLAFFAAPAGMGTKWLIAQVNDAIASLNPDREGEQTQSEKNAEDFANMFEAVKAGTPEEKAAAIFDQWWSSVLDGGQLGAYDWPWKPAYIAKTYYRGRPEAMQKIWMQQSLPPSVTLFGNILTEWADASNDESSFLEKAKKFLSNISQDNVVWLKKFYGQQKKEKPGKSGIPGAGSSSSTGAPSLDSGGGAPSLDSGGGAPQL